MYNRLPEDDVEDIIKIKILV